MAAKKERQKRLAKRTKKAPAKKAKKKAPAKKAAKGGKRIEYLVSVKAVKASMIELPIPRLGDVALYRGTKPSVRAKLTPTEAAKLRRTHDSIRVQKIEDSFFVRVRRSVTKGSTFKAYTCSVNAVGACVKIPSARKILDVRGGHPQEVELNPGQIKAIRAEYGKLVTLTPLKR